MLPLHVHTVAARPTGQLPAWNLAHGRSCPNMPVCPHLAPPIMQALHYLLQKCTVLPDLVLLDVMMPTVSGYEVAKRIREIWPSSVLPIIMVSEAVKGEGGGVKEALTLGGWARV